MRTVVNGRLKLLLCVVLLGSSRSDANFGGIARGDSLDPRTLITSGSYEAAEVSARRQFLTAIATNGRDSVSAARARDLFVEAALLNGRGSTPETRDLAEQSIDIKLRLLDDDPDRAGSFLNLAEVLTEVPDYRRGIELAQQAVSIYERSSGSQVGLARALDTLGSVLTQSGAYNSAIAALERGLSIREHTDGVNGFDTIRTLELLASALQRKGDYAAARPLIERAVSARDSRPRHPAEVRTFNLYSVQLWFEGRASEARIWAERALSSAETLLGKEHPAVARSLMNVAAASVILGDIAGARTLQERALTIAEHSLGPTHYETAACLNDLANSNLLLGEYSTARQQFERGLQIVETLFGPNHDAVATYVHNLALVDASLGDVAAARQEHDRATAIWERVLGVDHPFVAVALTELAVVLRDHGNGAQALPLLERALTIREHSLGNQHRDVALTLADLAATFSRLGRTDRAQPLAARALAIWERAETPDAPEFATALALYGELQSARGDPVSARAYLERALAIRAKVLGASHPAYADTQIGLALVLARLGDVPFAFQMARRGEDTGREHLRLMVRSLPERESLNYALSRPKALDLILSLVQHVPGATASAFDALVHSRALVLDEMMARGRFASPVAVDPVDPRAQLLSAQQRLASLVVRGPQGQATDRYSMLVDEARRAKEEAERVLAERSTRFHAELSYERAGFDDIRRALPAGSALVSFVRYRHTAFSGAAGIGPLTQLGTDVPSYLAFVTRSDQEPVAVPLGPASTLDALVARWRSDVSADSVRRVAAHNASAATRASGARLRRAIWDRLATRVEGATTLFVVPDDALSLVPLAALPGRRAEFVLEEAPVIHYLTAERDLVRTMGQAVASARSLLAVGGPAFDDASAFSSSGTASGSATSGVPALRSAQSHCESFQTMQFGPLAGTVQEVQDLAQLWRGVSAAEAPLVLVSSEATERLFKQEAPRHQVIHLATHGFFLGASCPSTTEGLRAVGGLVSESRQATPPLPPAIADSPLLLSGVALAGANRRASATSGDEDGILTAEEVSGLDLSGVLWAVLSACNTGVGEVRAGEGVFGLRRAFQMAGARTVIMSLWSVDDDSTRLWMHALYEGRLKRNLSTAVATREASLSVLRARRAAGRSTHPFFWGAFVAAGDWR